MTYRGQRRVRPSRVIEGVRHYQCRGPCGQWRAETAFRPLANPASTCGLMSPCKACEDAARAERKRRRALAAAGFDAALTGLQFERAADIDGCSFRSTDPADADDRTTVYGGVIDQASGVLKPVATLHKIARDRSRRRSQRNRGIAA